MPSNPSDDGGSSSSSSSRRRKRPRPGDGRRVQPPQQVADVDEDDNHRHNHQQQHGNDDIIIDVSDMDWEAVALPPLTPPPSSLPRQRLMQQHQQQLRRLPPLTATLPCYERNVSDDDDDDDVTEEIYFDVDVDIDVKEVDRRTTIDGDGGGRRRTPPHYEDVRYEPGDDVPFDDNGFRIREIFHDSHASMDSLLTPNSGEVDLLLPPKKKHSDLSPSSSYPSGGTIIFFDDGTTTSGSSVSSSNHNDKYQTSSSSSSGEVKGNGDHHVKNSYPPTVTRRYDGSASSSSDSDLVLFDLGDSSSSSSDGKKKSSERKHHHNKEQHLYFLQSQGGEELRDSDSDLMLHDLGDGSSSEERSQQVRMKMMRNRYLQREGSGFSSLDSDSMLHDAGGINDVSDDEYDDEDNSPSGKQLKLQQLIEEYDVHLDEAELKQAGLSSSLLPKGLLAPLADTTTTASTVTNSQPKSSGDDEGKTKVTIASKLVQYALPPVMEATVTVVKFSENLVIPYKTSKYNSGGDGVVKASYYDKATNDDTTETSTTENGCIDEESLNLFDDGSPMKYSNGSLITASDDEEKSQQQEEEKKKGKMIRTGLYFLLYSSISVGLSFVAWRVMSVFNLGSTGQGAGGGGSVEGVDHAVEEIASSVIQGGGAPPTTQQVVGTNAPAAQPGNSPPVMTAQE